VGDNRGVVMFVDNRARQIYGQRYFEAEAEALDGQMRRFAET